MIWSVLESSLLLLHKQCYLFRYLRQITRPMHQIENIMDCLARPALFTANKIMKYSKLEYIQTDAFPFLSEEGGGERERRKQFSFWLFLLLLEALFCFALNLTTA